VEAVNGPEATLRAWLKNNDRGFTRDQLARLLHQDDRRVRRMIEAVVTNGELPIICDRDGGGEGRYRIARADEVDRVRREHDELVNRARATLAHAKGLVRAHEGYHSGGILFAPATPSWEAAYETV